MPNVHITATLFFILHALLCVANPIADSLFSTDEYGDYNGLDLIEWINSHPQGYVHPSIRIGRRRPGDQSSIIGTFASSSPDAQPINKGDVIAAIPWDHLIGPGDEYNLGTFFSCRAIHNLAVELKLGEKSQYAPYVRYLLTQTISTMPGEWSRPAQEFLKRITGSGELPPLEREWMDGSEYKTNWLEHCKGDPNDIMQKFAFYLSSNRDEDTLMIPIYDMLNHSNDPDQLNTLSYKPNVVGEPFIIKANRLISADEEIFNCYNRCHACSKSFRDECETYSFRGTAELFAHYGFVEGLPQYWWFDHRTDQEVIEMEFCLEKNENTGGFIVTWIEFVPSDDNHDFFKQHLERLGAIEHDKELLENQLVQANGENEVSKMSSLEWNSCWTYHDALRTAMSAAMDSLQQIKLGGDLNLESNEEDGDEL